MGIGSLKEISLAVSKGFDIFDCVLPTRLGRHGTAFFNDERLNLRNARFKKKILLENNWCLHSPVKMPCEDQSNL